MNAYDVSRELSKGTLLYICYLYDMMIWWYVCSISVFLYYLLWFILYIYVIIMHMWYIHILYIMNIIWYIVTYYILIIYIWYVIYVLHIYVKGPSKELLLYMQAAFWRIAVIYEGGLFEGRLCRKAIWRVPAAAIWDMMGTH